ncbi:MAG: hypothetical protein PHR53_07195, partial [Bacteroidales bacterium]|nr:hypothetical protein [Bacteroidales bacterium]
MKKQFTPITELSVFSNINEIQKSRNASGYIIYWRRVAFVLVMVAGFCLPSWAQTTYTIDNVAELQVFRDGINSGAAFTYKGNDVPACGEGIHFKLTADLDLSSVCGASVGSGTSWTPIGNNTNRFKGHFHGGGHSISNLYINAPTSDYQGLFGYMYGGSIDSLNLVNTN